MSKLIERLNGSSESSDPVYVIFKRYKTALERIESLHRAMVDQFRPYMDEDGEVRFVPQDVEIFNKLQADLEEASQTAKSSRAVLDLLSPILENARLPLLSDLQSEVRQNMGFVERSAVRLCGEFKTYCMRNRLTPEHGVKSPGWKIKRSEYDRATADAKKRMKELDAIIEQVMAILAEADGMWS